MRPLMHHGAGTASAAIADPLAAGDVEVVAQGVEQRDARFDVRGHLLAVDGQLQEDRRGTVAGGRGGLGGGGGGQFRGQAGAAAAAAPVPVRKPRRDKPLLRGSPWESFMTLDPRRE